MWADAAVDKITDDETSLDAQLLEKPMKGNLGEIKITVDHATHLVRQKIEISGKSEGESLSDEENDGKDDGGNKGKKSDRNNRKKRSRETIPPVRKVLENSKKSNCYRTSSHVC